MKITPFSWARYCWATATAEDEPPENMMTPSRSIMRWAACARGVGVGLGVADDVVDLLAEHAVALERRAA